MPDSEAVAVLRTALKGYLDADFAGYEIDRDGDFVVAAGSARVFIRPLEQGDRTLVRIWSITNVDLRVDGALTGFLATENARIAFGKFNLHEEQAPAVHLSHTLLGDFLNREELQVAVVVIAQTADEYDDRIKARFGGRLFTEAPDALAQLLAAADAEAEPETEMTVAVRAVFTFVAVVAAIAGSVYAYSVEESVWLSIFVALIALQLFGRGIPDVITDPDKVVRALYFLFLPALATGILAVTYALSGRWWLSVPIALVGAVILNTLLAPRLFPRIHQQETLDSARRLAQALRPEGGG